MHKKACKKRAAELHDEQLFKEHPPREDCPICMLPLPLSADQVDFKSCCGKLICSGCMYAMIETAKTNKQKRLCAFCRMPSAKSVEEEVERTKKLIEKGNATAFYVLGGYYANGTMGLPQDCAKANELYLKAGELGCCDAYHNLGNSYYYGRGVATDMKKAKHYYELGAMNGSVQARYNLGCMEGEAGNRHLGIKHFILAARAGHEGSLNVVKKGFMKGWVTKDNYASTLRAYQNRTDEMKSDMRDIAANS